MIKFIDIFLIGVIICIIYLIYRVCTTEQIEENYADTVLKNREVEDCFTEEKISIYPIFVKSQYNDNYRDTVTAFNNMVPVQKDTFNENNLPIEKTNPDHKEISKMVSDFIEELNKNICQVPENRNINSGWDEMMPEKKVKSGWDKSMEELGLPSNIYDDPAKKEIVKLIKICKVKRIESDKEIKYIVSMYIQKSSV